MEIPAHKEKRRGMSKSRKEVPRMKIMWDAMIVVVQRKRRIWMVIDIARTDDNRIREREEKLNNYDA